MTSFRLCRGLTLAALLLAVGACSKSDDKSARNSGEIKPPDSLIASSTGPNATVAQRPVNSPDALTPLVRDPAARTYALQVSDRGHDRSVAPAVIDLILFSKLGVVEELRPNEIEILRRLTGQAIPAGDWREWIEWWWREGEGKVHSGYPALKRYLYMRVRPQLGSVLNPDSPSVVDRTEIIPRPGFKVVAINPMVDPKIVSHKAPLADYIIGSDRVVGIDFNGERRAYPLRVLHYHEIINDTIGGKKIVVTYNGLTNSAYAYEADVEGQGPLKFGYTGLLYRADSLIYDEKTASLWSSREGTPIMGSLCRGADSPKLKRIPVTFSSWHVWRNTYYDTTTVTLPEGRELEYSNPDPFAAVYANADQLLPMSQRDNRLPMKERVLGIALNGEAVAFPYGELTNLDLIYNIIGGETVAILCFSYRDEFRAYRVGDRRLSTMPSPYYMSELATQSDYRITEASLRFGMEGSARIDLERVPADVTTWYAWQMWHPETRIYHKPEGPVGKGEINVDPVDGKISIIGEAEAQPTGPPAPKS